MDHELLRLIAIEPPRHRVKKLLVPERAGGRTVATADDVVSEDLEHWDRVRTRILREEHVAALLIATGAMRVRLDADLPVEDRLRSIVESRQVQEIALRAPPVDVLVAVDIDPLAIPGGDKPEELHDRAVAFDVRLDSDLRSARPREHVQAP